MTLSVFDALRTKIGSDNALEELLWFIHDPTDFCDWTRSLHFDKPSSFEENEDLLWLKASARFSSSEISTSVKDITKMDTAMDASASDGAAALLHVATDLALFALPEGECLVLGWAMKLEQQNSWSLSQVYPELVRRSVPKSMAAILTTLTEVDLCYSTADFEAAAEEDEDEFNAVHASLCRIWNGPRLRRGLNFSGKVSLTHFAEEISEAAGKLLGKDTLEALKAFECKPISLTGRAGVDATGLLVDAVVQVDFSWEPLPEKLKIEVKGVRLRVTGLEGTSPKYTLGLLGEIKAGNGPAYRAEVQLLPSLSALRLVAGRIKGDGALISVAQGHSEKEWVQALVSSEETSSESFLDRVLQDVTPALGDVQKYIPTLYALDLTLPWTGKGTLFLQLGYTEPLTFFNGIFTVDPLLEISTNFTIQGTRIRLRGMFSLGESEFDFFLSLPDGNFAAGLANGSSVDLSGFLNDSIGWLIIDQPEFRIMTLDFSGNARSGTLSLTIETLGSLRFRIGSYPLEILGVALAMEHEEGAWTAQFAGEFSFCDQLFSVITAVTSNSLQLDIMIPSLDLDSVFRELSAEAPPETLNGAMLENIFFHLETGSHANLSLEGSCRHTFVFEGFTLNVKSFSIAYSGGDEPMLDLTGAATLTVGKISIYMEVKYNWKKDAPSEWTFSGEVGVVEVDALMSSLTDSLKLNDLKSEVGTSKLKKITIQLQSGNAGTTFKAICEMEGRLGKSFEFPLTIQRPAVGSPKDTARVTEQKSTARPEGQDSIRSEALKNTTKSTVLQTRELTPARKAAAAASPFIFNISSLSVSVLRLDVDLPSGGHKARVSAELLFGQDRLLFANWEPGEKIQIATSISRIDLGTLVQDLSKGMGINLPTFDLVLLNSRLLLEHQSDGSFSLALGTVVQGAGAVALNVFKRHSTWALAFGIAINRNALDRETSLGRWLKTAMDAVWLEELYLVASTAAMDDLRLTTIDEAGVPAESNTLAVEAGVNVKARWDLGSPNSVPGLSLLQDTFNLTKNFVEVNLFIGNSVYRLSTTFNTTIKDVQIQGEFGFRKDPDLRVYLKAQTQAIDLFGTSVRFALSATGSSSGVTISGMIKGSVRVAGKVSIADIGLAITIGPTSVQLGFTGMISVGSFNGFVALFLVSGSIAFSASISDIDLYGLASGLVEVPSSMASIFKTIRIFGLKKGSAEYRLSLPSSTPPKFPDQLLGLINSTLGTNLERSSCQVQVEGDGWYVLDQKEMVHYLVKPTPNHPSKVDIFHKVQIYYAPQTCKIGSLELPRGFRCVVGLQILDFEAIVDIFADTERLTAYASLTPIVYKPSPALFSIVGMNGTEPDSSIGPILSISTKDIPEGIVLREGQLREKHIYINGYLRLLGAGTGVTCKVTEDGLDLRAIYKIGDSISLDLLIKWGKEIGLSIGGKFEVQLGKLDLLVKEIDLNTAIVAEVIICIGGPNAALIALFRASGRMLGQDFDLGEFRIDVTYGQFNDFKEMIYNETVNKALDVLGLGGPKKLDEKGRWIRVRVVNDTGRFMKYVGDGDGDMGVSHGRYWQKPTHISPYDEGILAVCNRDNSWTGVGAVIPFELTRENVPMQPLSISVSDAVIGSWTSLNPFSDTKIRSPKCLVEFEPYDPARTFDRTDDDAMRERTYQAPSHAPQYIARVRPGQDTLIYLYEPGKRSFKMLLSFQTPGSAVTAYGLTAAGRFFRRTMQDGRWTDWEYTFLNRPQSSTFTLGHHGAHHFAIFMDDERNIDCMASTEEGELREKLREFMTRVSYVAVVHCQKGNDSYLLTVNPKSTEVKTATLRNGTTVNDVKTSPIDRYRDIAMVARAGYLQVFLLGMDRRIHCLIAGLDTSQMLPTFTEEKYLSSGSFLPLEDMMQTMDDTIVANAEAVGVKLQAPKREAPRDIQKIAAAAERGTNSAQIFALDGEGRLWVARHKYDAKLRLLIQQQKPYKDALSRSAFEWTAWEPLAEVTSEQPLLDIVACYSRDAHLELFVILQDGTLCHTWSLDRGQTWNPWVLDFHDAPKLRSIICCPDSEDRNVTLFGLGREDGRGYSNWMTDGGWQGAWTEMS